MFSANIAFLLAICFACEVCGKKNVYYRDLVMEIRPTSGASTQLGKGSSSKAGQPAVPSSNTSGSKAAQGSPIKWNDVEVAVESDDAWLKQALKMNVGLSVSSDEDSVNSQLGVNRRAILQSMASMPSMSSTDKATAAATAAANQAKIISSWPESLQKIVDRGILRAEGTLGSGGFGAVYMVSYEYEPSKKHYYALKLQRENIKDRLNKAILEAELQELEWGQNLVAKVFAHYYHYDTVSQSGRNHCVYSMMELADSILPYKYEPAESGSAELVARARLFNYILMGVMNLHAHGVTHSDIKPANIFLFATGGRAGRDYDAPGAYAAKLGDFGLAFKGRKKGLSGTPHYFPVEMLLAYIQDVSWGAREHENLQRRKPKESTDIERGPEMDLYALALIAYGMKLGDHPYLSLTNNGGFRPSNLNPNDGSLDETLERMDAFLLMANTLPEDKDYAQAIHWAARFQLTKKGGEIPRTTLDKLIALKPAQLAGLIDAAFQKVIQLCVKGKDPTVPARMWLIFALASAIKADQIRMTQAMDIIVLQPPGPPAEWWMDEVPKTLEEHTFLQFALQLGPEYFKEEVPAAGAAAKRTSKSVDAAPAKAKATTPEIPAGHGFKSDRFENFFKDERKSRTPRRNSAPAIVLLPRPDPEKGVYVSEQALRDAGAASITKD